MSSAISFTVCVVSLPLDTLFQVQECRSYRP